MRDQLIEAADRLAGAFCLVSTAGTHVRLPRDSRHGGVPVFIAPTGTFHSALRGLKEIALLKAGKEVSGHRAWAGEEKLLLKMEKIREKYQRA